MRSINEHAPSGQAQDDFHWLIVITKYCFTIQIFTSRLRRVLGGSVHVLERMSETALSVSGSSGSDERDELLNVVDVAGTTNSPTAPKDGAVLACVAKCGTCLDLYSELKAGGEMTWGLPERWFAREDRESGSDGDIGGWTRVLRGNVELPLGIEIRN